MSLQIPDVVGLHAGNLQRTQHWRTTSVRTALPSSSFCRIPHDHSVAWCLSEVPHSLAHRLGAVENAAGRIKLGSESVKHVDVVTWAIAHQTGDSSFNIMHFLNGNLDQVCPFLTTETCDEKW